MDSQDVGLGGYISDLVNVLSTEYIIKINLVQLEKAALNNHRNNVKSLLKLAPETLNIPAQNSFYRSKTGTPATQEHHH